MNEGENPGLEVEREARRVFRTLTTKGLFLVPEPDGRYALAGTKRAGRVLRVAAVHVEEFCKRGWLDVRGTRPETFVLSDAGSTWLARMTAFPNPFAVRHQIRVLRSIKTEDGGEALVSVNEAESPLARLRVRGMIEPAQYDAGEKLRRDFTLAHLMPRLCADLSSPISNGRGAKAPPQAEAVVAAKQRFRLAMSAVGPGLSDLLFDVCCHLRGLELVEGNNGWPVRSGKVVLQIALDRLAAHYGIASPMTRRGRIRGWQAPSEAKEAFNLGL